MIDIDDMELERLRITSGSWKNFEYLVTSSAPADDEQDYDIDYIVLKGPRDTMKNFDGLVPIFSESEIDVMFRCVGSWPEAGEQTSVLLERVYITPADAF